MDWNRAKISAEVFGLRFRAKIKLAVSVIGIGLVLLGAYNMLAAPLLGGVILAGYRSIVEQIIYFENGGAIAVADVLLIAIGSILTWIS